MRTHEMGTTEQIEQLEVSIKHAEAMIELGNAYQRLSKNKDWKLVIESGYFVKEASRIVAAKSNPGMAGAEQQQWLDHLIMGIGGLQQYFVKIHQMAMEAENTLLADEETQTEILSEG